MYRVKPSWQLAEFAKQLSVQVILKNFPDTSDEDHLIRTRSDAQGPSQGADFPFLLEVALGVEDLHAAVLAVGHIQSGILVHHDVMRGIELTGFGAAIAPILNQISLPRKLHDARISVAVS